MVSWFSSPASLIRLGGFSPGSHSSYPSTIPRSAEFASEEGGNCNNVTFRAESSQSRSHMTTTNHNLTPSSLTSITALGSSSSTPLSRWRSVPPHLPQSRRYVYLQVGRLFRCNGCVSGMIRTDKGEQRVMMKT